MVLLSARWFDATVYPRFIRAPRVTRAAARCFVTHTMPRYVHAPNSVMSDYAALDLLLRCLAPLCFAMLDAVASAFIVADII